MTAKPTGTSLSIHFICLFFILASYVTTRYVAIIAGVIGLCYIFSRTTWPNRFSLMFFLLPFVHIFKLGDDQTSLYMVLRLAIIFSALIYDYKIFNFKSLFIYTLVFVIYCTAISLGNEIDFVVRLVNIILWIMLIYIMQKEITPDDVTQISKALWIGTVISAFIGMNLDVVPELEKTVTFSSYTLETGGKAMRFAGLFNDPNRFTILVCLCVWTAYFELSKNKISLTTFLLVSISMTFFGTLTYSKSYIILIALFWLFVVLKQSNIKVIYQFLIAIFFIGAVSYYMINNPDWFENMFARFKLDDADIDSLTTGRTRIWRAYMEYFYQSGSWGWGNGLYPGLVYGRSTHNFFIEIFFHMGLVGTFLYAKYMQFVYKQTPKGYAYKGVNKLALPLFFSLLTTAFFLEGLFQEPYYWYFALCFIYLKKSEKKENKQLQS